MRRLDPFLLLILATLAVASLLPARGMWVPWFDHATTVAIGLLFFLYGVRLSPAEALAGLRHWRLHGLVALATFAVFPLLGLAVRQLPPTVLPASLAAGVLLLCCMPSTVQSSIAFTSVARGNVAAALCAASLSNLAGVVLTPLLVAMLMSARGGVSTAAVLDVAAQLLAPFLAGQLLRRWIGDWVVAHRRWLTVVDRGSIMLVVYVAFGAGVRAGIWHQLSPAALGVLAVLVAALLGVVLALTWWVPRLLGFDRADRITIMFCGSKKSLASGLPMAGVLFAGPGLAVLVLPLMLFHQLQLMVCAWLAGRLARAGVDEVDRGPAVDSGAAAAVGAPGAVNGT